MPNASMTLTEQRRAEWRSRRIPISEFFELTPRCNFDCKMCFAHLTPEQMGDRKELSTEDWLRVSDEAVEAGMLYCVLTGGECMLHPGFWQIYEHLLSRGVALSVNTNGWALTDEDIARFRENPPHSIRITLYGASEESYQRTTGRRAFRRVVENIGKLKAAGLKLRLAATLTRQNQEDHDALIALAASFDQRLHVFFDLFQPNEDVGRRAADSCVEAEDIVRLELAEAKRTGRPLYRNEPIAELPPRLPDDPSSRGLSCGAGRVSFTVRWDGELVACYNVNSGKYVQNSSVQEAWKSLPESYESFVVPVECQSCRLLRICHPCAYVRQDPNDPGHANPERCKLTVLRYHAGLISLQGDQVRMDNEADSPDNVHDSL